MFGGVDPPGGGKWPPRDLRDWQAIHAWALGTLARESQWAGCGRKMKAIAYNRYGPANALKRVKIGRPAAHVPDSQGR